MTLFWLKTNPTLHVLASRFGVKSISTTSNALDATLGVLDDALTFAVGSSGRDVGPDDRAPHLQSDTQFADITEVADTTLIPIEKPHHHDLNAETFSTYKYNYYGKVFLSCDAAGRAKHISPVYGGAASDAQVAEHSGWYDQLQPGDQVLYDKGGTAAMRKRVESREAILIQPTEVINTHMTLGECYRSRDIARARVLIENLNSSLKRFRIFRAPIESALFHRIDTIVRV
jgi:hypothetical protein